MTHGAAALFRRRIDPIPPETTIELADGSIARIDVRVSPRARRVALRITADRDRVELVLPQGMAFARALPFVTARRDWIAGHLAKIPQRIPFLEDMTIPVLGRDRVIVAVGPGGGRRPTFHLTETSIEVTGAPEHLERRVRDGLVALARQHIRHHALALSPTLNRPIRRISLGDPRSRWGSCSSSGSLRFSWRLILTPEPVLRYVVGHEMAHLVHMNHGADFWDVVARLVPDHLEQRAWLRNHGATLLRYG